MRQTVNYTRFTRTPSARTAGRMPGRSQEFFHGAGGYCSQLDHLPAQLRLFFRYSNEGPRHRSWSCRDGMRRATRKKSTLHGVVFQNWDGPLFPPGGGRPRRQLEGAWSSSTRTSAVPGADYGYTGGRSITRATRQVGGYNRIIHLGAFPKIRPVEPRKAAAKRRQHIGVSAGRGVVSEPGRISIFRSRPCDTLLVGSRLFPDCSSSMAWTLTSYRL